MRIAFIGAVEISRKTLTALIQMQSNVVGVCTLEESAANADHYDLSGICETRGIPWIYAPEINSDETIAWLKEKAPDVIFCIGWSRLLRKALLTMAPLGVVGFHPAALPFNRGRHPIIWALALGLPETAATFLMMDEGADTGDIVSQRIIKIAAEDNAGSLYEKITQSALEQLQVLVPQLADGSFVRSPQDKSAGNVWRKRGERDGQIDWRMSARCIHNLVRGLNKPYIGAHFLFRGIAYKVWRTELVEDVQQNLEPGKVIAVTESGPVIRCGEQGIRIVDIEPGIEVMVGEYL